MRVRGPKSGFRKTIPLRRSLGLKFRKQHGIGPYIVDFYCPAMKLIIEIDGDSHAEIQTRMQDEERTVYLESLGYTVIRYRNRDIIDNIDGVFEDLTNKINQL